MNVTKINKQKKKIKSEQHFYNKVKNKYVHLQIKTYHEHLKNITKISKCKKLNMAEHKTDMSITKIYKCKKNWTAIL